MKNKYKFWIIFFLIVVFGVGFIGGIFSDRYFFQKRPGRPERSSAHFPSLERMAKDLGLSADQQEQIRKIFERNETKLKELRADMHGRLRSIRAELKNEIDNVLTADQRQKIETMIKKFAGPGKKEFEERGDKNNQNQQPEKDRGEKR
jgi:Spy/CpxP family protein refolding chaperone